MGIVYSRLLACLAALPVARPTPTQVLYGSIVGTSQDQSGAVIPSATITITSKQTGLTRETVSDSGGHYLLVNLPGSCDLCAVADF